jgi:hypothetical protein
MKKKYILVHGFTALCWTLTAFLFSRSFTQSVGPLRRGISQSQGRYLHTGQHQHRINAQRYPCLKWDSNLRSQLRASGDRTATVTSKTQLISPHNNSFDDIQFLQIFVLLILWTFHRTIWMEDRSIVRAYLLMSTYENALTIC